MKLSMFDRVIIRTVPETTIIELAGSIGQVLGYTQPSSSGATDIIGGAPGDFAINVFFESLDSGFWFNPELIEFADHSSVTELALPEAGITWLPDAHGQWQLKEIDPP